ncbi:hypothetical protein KR059_004155, partial [Drosophila kikkawai]
PPQTYCGQPPPPERCYEPPQRCCCQDNPPPCQDRNPCECRDTRRRKRRCCRRKKGCSSESLCVVTHEVSVQTEGDPCKPADLIEIVDVTTQEKEVRHRTGEVELTVDEVQTVTVVPGDGSKATRNQVQSHISSRDSSKVDNSQRVQRQFEQEVDPTSVEVPTKAMRYSELEPMMENIKDIPSVASSGSASPSEVKEHRVYRTNTKFEHDFGINSGKKETKTFLEDTHDVKDSKQKSSAGSRTPLNRSAPKRSTKIGPPSSKEGLTTRQRKPNTIDTGIRRPNSKIKESKDSQNIWWNSEESNLNKSKASNIIREVSNKRIVDSKELEVNKKEASNMIEDYDGKLVRKPRASIFPDKSTIHVKVNNRREKHTRKAGRKSLHQEALFETKISELRLLEEAEPKPKRRKRKKVPKKEAKWCYPTNEMVCRFHRPLRRQICQPRTCRAACEAGCRRCCLPCIFPCSRSLYPPCVPPLCAECDPICGFSRCPTTCYCH